MARQCFAATAALLVSVSHGYHVLPPSARMPPLRMATDVEASTAQPSTVEKALTSAIALPISLVRATRSEAQNAQIDAAADLETAVNSATNAATVVGASVGTRLAIRICSTAPRPHQRLPRVLTAPPLSLTASLSSVACGSNLTLCAQWATTLCSPPSRQQQRWLRRPPSVRPSRSSARSVP